MARNAEKAQSLFNRWTTYRLQTAKTDRDKKHSEKKIIEDVPEAEKQRRTIVTEVSKKIASIQNASLGEQKIRELNDEINKDMKDKDFWDRKILALGGPDYTKSGQFFFHGEGVATEDNPDYFYYGRAKDLPGIRELLETDEKITEDRKKRKSEGQYPPLPVEYFGYYDEVGEDGARLLAVEAEKEGNLTNQFQQDEMARKMQRLNDMKEMGIAVSNDDDDGDDDEDVVGLVQLNATNRGEMANAEIVSKAIMEKRKANLMMQL